MNEPVRRRGLGMGLSALLGPNSHPQEAHGTPHTMIPVEHLSPSAVQPRRRFTEADLATLAASIREHGILQPILVRPLTHQPGRYEIIAGERRWRAAQLAAVHELPVVVRELDDRSALEIALVENLQREDLSPIEEAEAFRRLIDDFGHTQEGLGAALGRSRSHIANTLRLLGLPEPVRAMLEAGALSAGHARALLGAPSPEALAHVVIAKDLSVRQTEALVKDRQASPRSRTVDANVADLERDLSRRLGLAVAIRASNSGGTVTLRYSRHEQLEAILRQLA